MPAPLTHERYMVDCICSGTLDTFQRQSDAFHFAGALSNHSHAGDAHAITVFDLMARRGQSQTWAFSLGAVSVLSTKA